MLTSVRISLTAFAAAVLASSGCGLLHRHHPPMPPYWVVDLGPLPGGKTSQVFDVNDNGDAVGRADFGGSRGHQHAVVWESGKAPRDLESRPKEGSEADRISAGGRIVGWAVRADHISVCEFDNSSAVFFFRTAATMSVPFGVDDSGDIGVTWDASTGEIHSGVDGDHGPSDIGRLPGYRDTTATAMSTGGSIVGNADNGDGGKRAFLWSNKVLTPLDPPAGFTNSYAYGLSRRGDIAGSCSQGAKHFQAVAWLDGKPQLLTAPATKDSEAYAVDDAGEFVGQCNNHACLWRQGRLFDLNAMIGKGKAVLNKAVAINNAGVIACNGTINKQLHAFLLTPSHERRE